MLRAKLEEIRRKRKHMKEVVAEVSERRNQTLDYLDSLHRERQQFLEELESILQQRHSLRQFLKVAERWNVMNDCFHIWHQGPFASINNCRLGAEAPTIPSVLTTATEDYENNQRQTNNVYTGKHSGSRATTTTSNNPAPAPPPPAAAASQWGWTFFSSSQVAANDTSASQSDATAAASVEAPKVPWTEVNAALGHVVLLVQILSDFHVQKLPHALHSMGATSKITIKGSLYHCYFEESSLWGRHNLRNFHTALNGLCDCIRALSNAQTDKTIAMPHDMVYDNSSWKIGGMPLVHGYGSISGVEFTRACKYLLTNLKWLVAYSVKHHAER